MYELADIRRVIQEITTRYVELANMEVVAKVIHGEDLDEARHVAGKAVGAATIAQQIAQELEKREEAFNE